MVKHIQQQYRILGTPQHYILQVTLRIMPSLEQNPYVSEGLTSHVVVGTPLAALRSADNSLLTEGDEPSF